MRVVLDSSGWIELSAGSDRAILFESALQAEKLFVPSVVRYEVGRYAPLHKEVGGRELALTALSKFNEVPVDERVADTASELAQTRQLALANALVYAAAQIMSADLWTQDKDFEQLPNVKYFPQS